MHIALEFFPKWPSGSGFQLFTQQQNGDDAGPIRPDQPEWTREPEGGAAVSSNQSKTAFRTRNTFTHWMHRIKPATNMELPEDEICPTCLPQYNQSIHLLPPSRGHKYLTLKMMYKIMLTNKTLQVRLPQLTRDSNDNNRLMLTYVLCVLLIA